MVPLLARIEKELAETADPGTRGELLAERACYLARVGEFEEAQRIVDGLRRAFEAAGNVRIAAYFMLAEGLIQYFAHTNQKAVDRIFRSYALCNAFKVVDLTQLTAAWRAHVELNRTNYSIVSSMLSNIYIDPESIDPRADLRASIVVADAFMTAGETRRARQWYERSRRKAVAAGDESAIASIIYNRAVLTVNGLSLLKCEGAFDSSAASAAFMEIRSAKSFHVVTGHASMFQMIEVAEARCLMLIGDHKAAAAIFTRLLSQPDLCFGFTPEQPLIEVELAVCLTESDQLESAFERFHNLDLKRTLELAVEDALQYWHWYGWLASRFAGIPDAGEEQKLRSSVQVQQLKQSLLEALNKLALPEPLALR